MKALIRKLCRDIRGQDLVEFALATGLAAVAAIAAMPILTGTFQSVINKVGAIIEAQVK